jgi:hypothetical protein
MKYILIAVALLCACAKPKIDCGNHEVIDDGHGHYACSLAQKK